MPARDLKSGARRKSSSLDEIQQMGVVVRNPREVLSYLGRYPDIEDILPPLCRAARAQLPGDAHLSLEFYRDRGAEDAYPTLYVRQQDYAPDILQRIDAVSTQFESWLERCSGWILLTTDFHSPG